MTPISTGYATSRNEDEYSVLMLFFFFYSTETERFIKFQLNNDYEDFPLILIDKQIQKHKKQNND